MIDDDDKVRRNIVVASAAVILVSWLKLPLTDLGERFLSVKTVCEAVKISEVRVWIAVLAVLAYMALRYFWSKEVMDARTDIRANYLLYYGKLVNNRYLKKVERWAKINQFPEKSSTDLQSELRKVVLSPSADDDNKGKLEKLTFILLEANPLADHVKVKVTGYNILNGGSHIATGDLKIPVDTRRRAFLKGQATLYAHLWSKGSLSILWPAMLWLVAVSICGVRLFQLAYGRLQLWL